MHQMALTMDQAQARGADGMLRAAQRNELKNAGWSTRALAAVVSQVKRLPLDAEFTMEDVREAVEDQLPIPTDRRAWGAVTQTAVRLGYIERSKGRTAPAKSSNGSDKPLYHRGRALF